MYKLYIKQSNGEYTGPKYFKDYETAVSHAVGEYLIIKSESKKDEVVEYHGRNKDEKFNGFELEPEDDDDWTR